MSQQDNDTCRPGIFEEKDPSGKIQWILGLIITVAILLTLGGIAYLAIIPHPSVTLGRLFVISGIAVTVISIIALILTECIEYRNDLIKQEITILQEVRKDIQSLKAKESSSDDQSNPETVQTESSDNL